VTEPDRPNHIAAWAWGIHEGSPARRRQALRSLLSPSVMVLICLACAITLFDFASARYFPTFGDAHYQQLFASGWWVGVVFCMFIPFGIETRFSNARILRGNLHDYYLAGFSGPEILLGMAAPAIAGIKSFAVVYFGAMLFFCVALTHRIAHGSSLILFFSILIPSLFNLAMGTIMQLTLWTQNIRRELKTMYMGLMMFTSPSSVYMLALPLILMNGFAIDSLVVLIPAELLSMLLRCLVVDYMWDRALDRLEMRDDSWRDPVREPARPAQIRIEAGDLS
jgi:hypothetical protein